MKPTKIIRPFCLLLLAALACWGLAGLLPDPQAVQASLTSLDPQLLLLPACGLVINPGVLLGLHRNFKALTMRPLGAYKPIHSRLALPTKSTAAEEVLTWLGSFPRMRKFKGEPDIANLISSTWRIANEPWHNTVGLKREDIERDRIGQYAPRFTLMGEDAAQHPDFLLTDLLTGGFAQKDYTGKNFFDTDKKHITGGKSKWTNKSTYKLTQATFEAGRKTLLGVLDEDSRPMFPNPELLLVVGPELLSTAENIVDVRTLPNGGENSSYKKAEILLMPTLGTSTAWFLLNVGSEVVRPFCWQEEVVVEFTSQTDPSSDRVFHLKEYAFQAYRRGNMAYLCPQAAYGSTGADTPA